MIDKANGHYGSCINTALPQATGTYVKILDADDSLDPAALTSLLNLLSHWTTSTNAPDMLITDWCMVTPNGATHKTITYPTLPRETFSIETLLALRHWHPRPPLSSRPL